MIKEILTETRTERGRFGMPPPLNSVLRMQYLVGVEGGVSRRGAFFVCIVTLYTHGIFIGLNVKVAFVNVEDELSILLFIVVSCTVIVYNLRDQQFSRILLNIPFLQIVST